MSTQNFAFQMPMWVLFSSTAVSYRGADKSLARPRRKQATATKLEIYSTYVPWSSIHFLARCSNFCKPLKNNSEGCPSNHFSAEAMTSASDENWRPFNCFFSLVGLRIYQHPCKEEAEGAVRECLWMQEPNLYCFVPSLSNLHHFGWGLCYKITILQLKILAIF